MPKYKDFLVEFEKKLPKFLQKDAHKIADDIIEVMHSGIAEGGVEIRGNFSIYRKQNAKRRVIIFRNLAKNIKGIKE